MLSVVVLELVMVLLVCCDVGVCYVVGVGVVGVRICGAEVGVVGVVVHDGGVGVGIDDATVVSCVAVSWLYNCVCGGSVLGATWWYVWCVVMG